MRAFLPLDSVFTVGSESVLLPETVLHPAVAATPAVQIDVRYVRRFTWGKRSPVGKVVKNTQTRIWVSSALTICMQQRFGNYSTLVRKAVTDLEDVVSKPSVFVSRRHRRNHHQLDGAK